VNTDGVNASPEDVKKLAAALTKYQAEVSSAGKRVQGALNSANWHDRQKDQFEGRLKDLQKTLDRFMSSEVQAMTKSLSELARRLEEIKRMRM
jgi:hypothetical protein